MKLANNYSNGFALSTSKSWSVSSECSRLFCNNVRISSTVSSVKIIFPFSKIIFQPLIRRFDGKFVKEEVKFKI